MLWNHSPNWEILRTSSFCSESRSAISLEITFVSVAAILFKSSNFRNTCNRLASPFTRYDVLRMSLYQPWRERFTALSDEFEDIHCRTYTQLRGLPLASVSLPEAFQWRRSMSSNSVLYRPP